jgi:hypothetical protein
LSFRTRSVVKEAGRKPPPYPFIFFKPNTCVHDHSEPVVIPRIAQDDQADYEGELVCLLAFSFYCLYFPYLLPPSLLSSSPYLSPAVIV